MEESNLMGIFSQELNFKVINESLESYHLNIHDETKELIAFDIASLIKTKFNYLTKSFINDYKDIIKRYFDECHTTFLIFTDCDFTDIDHGLIEQVKDAYPHYDLLFYTKDINLALKKEAIDKSNLKHTYNLDRYKKNGDENPAEDIVRHDQLQYKKNEPFIRLVRFVDLIKVYDDQRFKTANIILPHGFKPLDINPSFTITLKGFEYSNSIAPYLMSQLGGECDVDVYLDVEFKHLYKLEQNLNLFSVFEGIKVIKRYNDYIQCIYFYSFFDRDFFFEKNYYNAIEDIENSTIADVYSVIPVKYESLDRIIKNCKRTNNFVSNNILTGLRFQEGFEYAGIKKQNFNSRIRRIDLGNFYIQIFEEPHYNYYLKPKYDVINQRPIQIRLFISLDLLTHTAVLSLVRLGCRDKVTKYIDAISRNDVTIIIPESDYKHYKLPDAEEIETSNQIDLVYDELNQKEDLDSMYYTVDLEDYLISKYGITKVGQPKNLILSPFLNDEGYRFQDNQSIKSFVAALLYGETFYDPEEELGEVVDKEITELVNKENGEALYSYSSLYITKTSLLQCGVSYQDYVAERIDFGVVVLFYFELINLELSAIQIATSNISQFIKACSFKNNTMIKHKASSLSSKEVLATLDLIQEEYAKTAEFWDVQMNYHSSKKFIEMIRKKFLVDNEVKKLERTRKEVAQIYQSKKTKLQRRSSFILNVIGTLLTIIKVYDLLERIKEANEQNKLEELLLYYISPAGILRIAIFIAILVVLLTPVKRLIFRKIYQHRKDKKH